MSSSLLLNPATGKLFSEYIPSSISIPTNQISSPTTLGTSVSMIDGGFAQFLVAPANPAADDATLRVGDSLAAGSSVLRWNGIEFQVENTGNTYAFADFGVSPGPTQGTATLSNIRQLNGLSVPAVSAIPHTIPNGSWIHPIGAPNIMTQSVPVYAAVGQKILLTLSANLKLAQQTIPPTSDTLLSVSVEGVKGTTTFPIALPTITEVKSLLYDATIGGANTYTLSFQYVVVSTGETAWTFTLSAQSPLFDYNAFFSSPLVITATALQN